MMRVIRGVALVGTVAGLCFYTQTGFAQEKKSGEDLFKGNCVLCHGEDGHSQTTLGKQLGAFDLHSPEVQKKKDAELKTAITKGEKSMPPFGGTLSPEEVDKVLAYVREFGKKKK